MTLLLRILFVLGFCLATVGAAGFAQPREPEAVPLVAAGILLIVLSAVTTRHLRRRAAAAAGGGVDGADLAARLRTVLAATQAVERDAAGLEGAALVARLDEVLSGPCSELGGRNEEYAAALGLTAYARIWDGFATGERLLARARSMAADGYAKDARELLPRVRSEFSRAVAAAA